MSTEERVSVKTSVPRYQKEVWQEHADRLDMSQSEFVRTMVQAGRSGIDLEAPETHSPTANPGGSGLQDRILDVISSGGQRTFDELVEELTEDIDSRLEESLDELADEGLIQISPRGELSLNGEPYGDD